MATLDNFTWNIFSDDPLMGWSAEVSGTTNDQKEIAIVQYNLANVDRSAKEFYSATKIEKVIFNDPATIVFWLDGTKTVVKCDDKERYDPEKGLAMAISKKALGNQGNYYNEFKKWLPDKMNVAPTILSTSKIHVSPVAPTILSMSDTNQNAIKALEKSLTERIRNGELKTSDLYNQTILKDLLYGRHPYGKKGDQNGDDK